MTNTLKHNVQCPACKGDITISDPWFRKQQDGRKVASCECYLCREDITVILAPVAEDIISC